MESDYYGVAANQWVSTVDEHRRLATLLSDAGVTFVRMRALRWAHIQPTKRGGMSWGVWPAVYEAYTSLGMKILVPLLDTPAWATKGKPHTGVPKRRAWKKFVRAAARKFPSVYAWETWNEPDAKQFFTGTADQFIRMHKVAYKQIKKHSNAQVWGPTIVVSNIFKKKGKRIVDGVLASKKLDMFTYHDYGPPAAKVDNYHHVAWSVKGRYPISVTETSASGADFYFDARSEEEVALDVRKIYITLKGLGVKHTLWWPVKDYGGNKRGLMGEDYRAKKQLDALAFLIATPGRL